MPITRSTSNGNATYTHTFTALVAKIDNAYTSAAKYWCLQDGLIYDNLTNQQRMNLVHYHVKNTILEWGKSWLKEKGKQDGVDEYNNTVGIDE